MAKQGYAIRAEPPAWLRGPASVVDGWIVLDRQRAHEYHPYGASNLAFDLAAVSTPQDAIAFVTRYGLLRHGPQANEWREPYSEWQQESSQLRAVFMLKSALDRALEGAPEELQRLAPVIRPLWQGAPENDKELTEQAAKTIAMIVSEGLRGVEHRLIAMFEWGAGNAPNEFATGIHPTDLVGYAYHHVAQLLNKKVVWLACPECGQYFVPTDGRQRYCSPTCAGRARYRRWAEKQKATA
ncbi:MAG TPA: hypothetical protein GX714_10860 [Chloroflexi bacterium]|jgi:hypothetical protein|nr:hypothetical protein [Chloroflexota bacterium]